MQRAWFALSAERGYDEVMPPTFEYEEVFTRGAGAGLSSRLIRFVDQDGRLVALRADFTSSIARMAASRLAAEPVPLRLCYAGKVYRQQAEGGGRQRESLQLGAEMIGDPSPEADVEVLRLVIDTLRALDIPEFQINLGEMRFVRPLLEALPDRLAERARTAVDGKDRATLDEISADADVAPAAGELLAALPELIGRGPVLQRASELALGEQGTAAVDRLRQIDSLLTSDEREHVVYDLGEIRGLGYYTGIQFEVFVAGVGRAVGNGGRYDGLMALYGTDRPAVGFSLELDALARLLPENGA